MNIKNIKFAIFGFFSFLILLLILSLISKNIHRANTSEFSLKPITFSALPEWSTTDLTPSFNAFLKSCLHIQKLHNANLGTQNLPITLDQIKPICFAAQQLNPSNSQAIREFFEHWFSPVEIENHGNPFGLFTGYYLSQVHVSPTLHEQYKIPIYGVPKNLVMINLGLFRKELQGYSAAGKVEKGNIYPYDITRAQINAGAIKTQAPVLYWADNAIDVFFMEIQGSGIARFEDGKTIGLHYAGRNNLPYTAIGKVLLENKAIAKDQLSMQGIRKWLETHPDQAEKIMEQNKSFVFFKTENNFPQGAEETQLTPGYSLAVDNHFIPLGLPLWLVTFVPKADNPNNLACFYRLLIAQDTGGAIRGPIRGDVFWGAGRDAEVIAGTMKSRGRYFVLLPKSSLPRPLAGEG